MIISSKKENINIKTIPIDTIYLKGNKLSRFKPFKDATKIGLQMFKGIGLYISNSVISFILDILIYTLILILLKNIGSPVISIFIASFIARVFSSITNFLLNSKQFLGKFSTNKRYLIKYYILAALQILVSALLVILTNKLFNDFVINKVIIDLMLAIISYRVQVKYVFRRN